MNLFCVVLLIIECLNGANISTTNTYDSHEHEEDSHEEDYSLSGALTLTDDNELFVVKIEVDSDCSNIKFDFILSNNTGWFSVGIGGDYAIASSSESQSHSTDEAPISEALIMNGYAVVVISMDDVYESTLQAGGAPARQASNDLSCNGINNNGITHIECIRLYYTNDQFADDFYEFISGVNPIIYAWGPISTDGTPIQHGVNEQSYGEAHKGYIYMDSGDALCEYANTYAMSQSVNDSGTIDASVWMIVSIVFEVLFVIMVGVVIFLICKQNRTKKDKGKYLRTPTNESGFIVNTDDNNINTITNGN